MHEGFQKKTFAIIFNCIYCALVLRKKRAYFHKQTVKWLKPIYVAVCAITT